MPLELWHEWLMTRQEFHALRSLPGKTISVDVSFKVNVNTAPNLVFSDVPVSNGLGWDIVMNGTYKPSIPTVTYNFVLKSVGPICRLCVNGSHHNGSRTHKHELRDPSDPAENLPTTIDRPDLNPGMTPREIWDILMREANITHTGAFIDP